MIDDTKMVRCAIYTRKSTDEGLEKEFNTLDAQREAGEAYIKSQAHEGWRLSPEQYNDGGYSGGNMSRPGLTKLFEHIKLGLVDMVVVYKIDRLTRSLADFAKMVELFDQYKVSFVSVTQHFNTSSSMGRLTLNVLLSFAQFEREVSAERIRDKIAASKKKGMWMGGPLPLGYDSIDKKLIINPPEARVVREIFEQFIVFKSVLRLVQYLNDKGYRTKARRFKNGKISGGKPFDRFAIYNIIDNKLYIGEIDYKGQIYNGLHTPIIERKLWDEVHSLKDKATIDRGILSKTNRFSLLKGLLRCGCCDTAMVPNRSAKKDREYHYYTSLMAINEGYRKCRIKSIPAAEIEEFVLAKIKPFLACPEIIRAMNNKIDNVSEREIFEALKSNGSELLDNLTSEELKRLLDLIIEKVIVYENDITIKLKNVMTSLIDNTGFYKEPDLVKINNHYEIKTEISIGRKRGRMMILVSNKPSPQINLDKQLITAVVRAFGWNDIIEKNGINLKELAERENLDRGYMGKILKLTLLAPDIVESILNGVQPRTLTVQDFIRAPIPHDWQEQRKKYGFI